MAPMLRVSLAAIHLLAFAMAISGVFTRGAALRRPVSAETLRRAFAGDNHWGIAAALLIATGLWRLLGATEKATSYYTHDEFFRAKMTAFLIVFLLELWPMVTLIRWRRALRHGATAEATAPAVAARRIAAISFVQGTFMVLMVVLAAAMARGFGAAEVVQ